MRYARTVRRRRLASLAEGPDPVALALPGVVCGLLGIALVLLGELRLEARPEAAARPAPERPTVAPVASEVWPRALPGRVAHLASSGGEPRADVAGTGSETPRGDRP